MRPLVASQIAQSPTEEVPVPRKARRAVVFNIYSLRVGTVVDTVLASVRLGRYTPDVARVEVVDSYKRVRLVRWRLENCRKFTPRALRSRKAFLLLARSLGVSSRSLRPRLPLWKRGFTAKNQRLFIRLLERECGIMLPARALNPAMTSNQVIAAVLAAPRVKTPPRRR